MDLFVGTSGYSYKEWKGNFYPEDLPAKRMLAYYAERFQTVEINNTFYRMPNPAVLESWAHEVPASFRFVLKAPQRITHIQRLKDAADSVAYLCQTAGVLKERLGPLLFQLPPNLKKDVPRLEAFLACLPGGRGGAGQRGAYEIRCAFEFRHASWLDDEVFALLRRQRAALCIAEAEDGLEIPCAATADWGYLRLRRPDYTDAELRAWAQRIRDQGWREAFVIFKHEEAGKGPQMAERFLELAGSRGAKLAAP